MKINKRWGDALEVSPCSLNDFKKLLKNTLPYEDLDLVRSDSDVIEYCNILRIEHVRRNKRYSGTVGSNIYDSIMESTSFEILFARLEIALNLDSINNKSSWYDAIDKIVSLSSIGVKVVIMGDYDYDKEITFVPEGEEFIDEKVVKKVLSFLGDKSNEHFKKALKAHLKKTPKKRIETVEAIRRSLEEYLKDTLGNNKNSLESNIKELGKALKDNDIDPRIINNIFKSLSMLEHFFNENSKHNDGALSHEEVEYVIYEASVNMYAINELLVNVK